MNDDNIKTAVVDGDGVRARDNHNGDIWFWQQGKVFRIEGENIQTKRFVRFGVALREFKSVADPLTIEAEV